MRNFAKVMTLTAALMAFGCGSDDGSFNNGGFNPNPNPNPVAVPTAVADAFQVLGGGILTGSVTSNDTLNGATVTAFQNPGTAGGTVAISAAGTLTYTPPTNGANLVDTFTYTIGNAAGSSTATVTVNVGAKGLFVKNDVPVSGSGSQASPFKTLAEAVTAAVNNGDQIVLFRGDGTNTGLNTGFTLKPGQGISSLDPAIPANITGPIQLTSGNSVSNLRIGATAGTAINATNASNGSITGVTVDSPTGRAVALHNATGTFAINNCTILTPGFTGIESQCSTGSLIWSVNRTAFVGSVVGPVVGNTTGNAAQNMTISNSSFVNVPLNVDAMFVDCETAGTNFGLNVNNNTVSGGGITGSGVSVFSGGSTNLLSLVSANNITGCVGEGIAIGVGGSSVSKARFTGNRTTGNALNEDLKVFLTGAATQSFGGVFQNNVSDRFVFLQNNLGPFQIEQFSQFNSPAAGNNTGVNTTTGTIIDVPAGSLNIP